MHKLLCHAERSREGQSPRGGVEASPPSFVPLGPPLQGRIKPLAGKIKQNGRNIPISPDRDLAAAARAQAGVATG